MLAGAMPGRNRIAGPSEGNASSSLFAETRSTHAGLLSSTKRKRNDSMDGIYASDRVNSSRVVDIRCLGSMPSVVDDRESNEENSINLLRLRADAKVFCTHFADRIHLLASEDGILSIANALRKYGSFSGPGRKSHLQSVVRGAVWQLPTNRFNISNLIWSSTTVPEGLFLKYGRGGETAKVFAACSGAGRLCMIVVSNSVLTRNLHLSNAEAFERMVQRAEVDGSDNLTEKELAERFMRRSEHSVLMEMEGEKVTSVASFCLADIGIDPLAAGESVAAVFVIGTSAGELYAVRVHYPQQRSSPRSGLSLGSLLSYSSTASNTGSGRWGEPKVTADRLQAPQSMWMGLLQTGAKLIGLIPPVGAGAEGEGSDDDTDTMKRATASSGDDRVKVKGILKTLLIPAAHASSSIPSPEKRSSDTLLLSVKANPAMLSLWTGWWAAYSAASGSTIGLSGPFSAPPSQERVLWNFSLLELVRDMQSTLRALAHCRSALDATTAEMLTRATAGSALESGAVDSTGKTALSESFRVLDATVMHLCHGHNTFRTATSSSRTALSGQAQDESMEVEGGLSAEPNSSSSEFARENKDESTLKTTKYAATHAVILVLSSVANPVSAADSSSSSSSSSSSTCSLWLHTLELDVSDVDYREYVRAPVRVLNRVLISSCAAPDKTSPLLGAKICSLAPSWRVFITWTELGAAAEVANNVSRGSCATDMLVQRCTQIDALNQSLLTDPDMALFAMHPPHAAIAAAAARGVTDTRTGIHAGALQIERAAWTESDKHDVPAVLATVCAHSVTIPRAEIAPESVLSAAAVEGIEGICFTLKDGRIMTVNPPLAARSRTGRQGYCTVAAASMYNSSGEPETLKALFFHLPRPSDVSISTSTELPSPAQLALRMLLDVSLGKRELEAVMVQLRNAVVAMTAKDAAHVVITVSTQLLDRASSSLSLSLAQSLSSSSSTTASATSKTSAALHGGLGAHPISSNSNNNNHNTITDYNGTDGSRSVISAAGGNQLVQGALADKVVSHERLIDALQQAGVLDGFPELCESVLRDHQRLLFAMGLLQAAQEAHRRAVGGHSTSAIEFSQRAQSSALFLFSRGMELSLFLSLSPHSEWRKGQREGRGHEKGVEAGAGAQAGTRGIAGLEEELDAMVAQIQARGLSVADLFYEKVSTLTDAVGTIASLLPHLASTVLPNVGAPDIHGNNAPIFLKSRGPEAVLAFSLAHGKGSPLHRREEVFAASYGVASLLLSAVQYTRSHRGAHTCSALSAASAVSISEDFLTRSFELRTALLRTVHALQHTNPLCLAPSYPSSSSILEGGERGERASADGLRALDADTAATVRWNISASAVEAMDGFEVMREGRRVHELCEIILQTFATEERAQALGEGAIEWKASYYSAKDVCLALLLELRLPHAALEVASHHLHPIALLCAAQLLSSSFSSSFSSSLAPSLYSSAPVLSASSDVLSSYGLGSSAKGRLDSFTQRVVLTNMMMVVAAATGPGAGTSASASVSSVSGGKGNGTEEISPLVVSIAKSRGAKLVFAAQIPSEYTAAQPEGEEQGGVFTEMPLAMWLFLLLERQGRLAHIFDLGAASADCALLLETFLQSRPHLSWMHAIKRAQFVRAASAAVTHAQAQHSMGKAKTLLSIAKLSAQLAIQENSLDSFVSSEESKQYSPNKSERGEERCVGEVDMEGLEEVSRVMDAGLAVMRVQDLLRAMFPWAFPQPKMRVSALELVQLVIGVLAGNSSRADPVAPVLKQLQHPLEPQKPSDAEKEDQEREEEDEEEDSYSEEQLVRCVGLGVGLLSIHLEALESRLSIVKSFDDKYSAASSSSCAAAAAEEEREIMAEYARVEKLLAALWAAVVVRERDMWLRLAQMLILSSSKEEGKERGTTQGSGGRLEEGGGYVRRRGVHFGEDEEQTMRDSILYRAVSNAATEARAGLVKDGLVPIGNDDDNVPVPALVTEDLPHDAQQQQGLLRDAVELSAIAYMHLSSSDEASKEGEEVDADGGPLGSATEIFMSGVRNEAVVRLVHMCVQRAVREASLA